MPMVLVWRILHHTSAGNILTYGALDGLVVQVGGAPAASGLSGQPLAELHGLCAVGVGRAAVG